MDPELVQAALTAARAARHPRDRDVVGRRARRPAPHRARAGAAGVRPPARRREPHAAGRRGHGRDRPGGACRGVGAEHSAGREPMRRPDKSPHDRICVHTSTTLAGGRNCPSGHPVVDLRLLTAAHGCERTVSSGGATRNRQRAVVRAMIRGESTPRRLRLAAGRMTTISALRRADVAVGVGPTATER